MWTCWSSCCPGRGRRSGRGWCMCLAAPRPMVLYPRGHNPALDAEQVHQLGLKALAEVDERVAELGEIKYVDQVVLVGGDLSEHPAGFGTSTGGGVDQDGFRRCRPGRRPWRGLIGAGRPGGLDVASGGPVAGPGPRCRC